MRIASEAAAATRAAILDGTAGRVLTISADGDDGVRPRCPDAIIYEQVLLDSGRFGPAARTPLSMKS